MSYNRTWYLYRSEMLRVRDFSCRAPRSGCGQEMRATADHLLITRRGLFLKHAAARGRDAITAEPAHVLLYNAGEVYRTSHPSDGGDVGTVFAFAPETARDVVRRYDRTTWKDGAPVFPVGHVLAPPSALLRAFRQRRRLEAGISSALEVEEEVVAILSDVARESARMRGVGAAWRDGETSRRRRDMVEAAKQLLAADPANDTSLTALARTIGVSPFHLTRMFREETGVPLHRFRIRLRLAAALERLADPAATLSAIGFDLGFSSHSHFTSAFRRLYGESPSAVRAGAVPRAALEAPAGMYDVATTP